MIWVYDSNLYYIVYSILCQKKYFLQAKAKL